MFKHGATRGQYTVEKSYVRKHIYTETFIIIVSCYHFILFEGRAVCMFFVYIALTSLILDWCFQSDTG